MSSAQVSEATQKPFGRRPIESGRRPWGSRAANRLRSSITTNENAPSSVGSTSTSADSRSSDGCRARIVATRSESVVAAPPAPTRSASSSVFTRLPLCPSASERWPSVLNAGWAFSQVVEPVVE